MSSSKYRVGLIVSSCVHTFLFTGAVFGWGGMVLLLEENGSFRCDDGEDSGCSSQTNKLINVGLTAYLSVIASPLLGEITDRYGGRTAAVTMSCFMCAGLGVVVIAINGVDWLFYVGFCLVALGSSLGGLLIVRIASYFVNQSRVVVLLNALFDAGAIVYLLLWYINKKLNDINVLMAVYFAVSVIVYGVALFFWSFATPETAFAMDSSPDDQSVPTDIETTRPNTPNEETKTSQRETRQNHTPKQTRLVKDRSTVQQLRSRGYCLIVAFWSIHFCNNAFTLTTARDFLAYLGDDDVNNKYLTIFTLLTPASVCGVPFVDRCIRKYGFAVAFQAINVLALTFSVIKVSSTNLNVQVLGFVVFSFFRCFFFGITFSFLPTFLSPTTLGKAIGIMYSLGAILSFINILLANLAVKRFEGDFFVPNLVYTVLVLPCIILAWDIGRFIKTQTADEVAVAK